MKNLANCKPTEFMVQTNKIRKSVSKWLTDTDIMSIRKRVPKLPDDATDEERREALERQINDNFNTIMDVIFEEHPQETLELLGLMCFVEPEHIDDHEVTEYLESFYELMSNQTVLNFFTSFMNWANRITT